VDLPRGDRWDTLLFGEGGARIVVSVSPQDVAAWEAYLEEQLSGSWQRLGTVSGELLQVSSEGETLLSLSLSQMGAMYEGAISRRLG
jgi:phosphoribosylformylglycinamidine synthase